MSAYDFNTMKSVGLAVSRPVCWALSWFTAHPQENGMTYGAHLRRAWYMAWRMGYGAVCLLIHGVFPAWFPTAGSRTVKSLYLGLRSEEERVKEEEVEKQV